MGFKLKQSVRHAHADAPEGFLILVKFKHSIHGDLRSLWWLIALGAGQKL